MNLARTWLIAGLAIIGLIADYFRIESSSYRMLSIGLIALLGIGLLISTVYDLKQKRRQPQVETVTEIDRRAFNWQRALNWGMVIVTAFALGFALRSCFSQREESPSETPVPQSVTSHELQLRLEDDFEDGVLDTAVWHGFSCAQGDAGEYDGWAHFELPENKSSGWIECILTPQVDTKTVNKISARVKLTDGKDESAGIGLFAQCGGDRLNFMVSPTWIGFFGAGLEENASQLFKGLQFSFMAPPAGPGVFVALLEKAATGLLIGSPIERTLTAEWTDSEVIFTVGESHRRKSVTCAEPPAFIAFGAGTLPGGYVNGAIDDVKIWPGLP